MLKTYFAYFLIYVFLTCQAVSAKNVSITSLKKLHYVANPYLCQKCHQKQYDFWQKTNHASAYLILFSKGQHFDPECIRCHTLGYGIPGEFEDITRPITLKTPAFIKKGFSPIEVFLQPLFGNTEVISPLDVRGDKKRYLSVKRKYHQALGKLSQKNMIKKLYLGVQCEHCHGSRVEHISLPTRILSQKKKVSFSSCLTCHKPPHAEWMIKSKLPLVSCPLIK